MTTKADLERSLTDALQELNVDEPPVFQAPARQRSTESRGLAIGIAVLLLVAIFVVGGYKAFTGNDDAVLAQIPPLQQQPFYPPVQAPSEVDELRGLVATLRHEVDDLKLANEKADLRSRQNREKIQVLGIVTNENTIIARHGYSRQYYMMVNRNWRLERAPKFLKISESDRQYIQSLVEGSENYGGILLKIIPGEPNELPNEAANLPNGVYQLESQKAKVLPDASTSMLRPDGSRYIGKIPGDVPKVSSHLAHQHGPEPAKDYEPMSALVELNDTQKDMIGRVQQLEESTRQLYARSRRNYDKIQVVGYVTNENASVLKNGHPDSDIIMLSSDWGLTALPKHCKLGPEGLAFMKSRSTKRD
tara:strand:- start:2564 stop:3649 length:1086 start_codon:yes stop_codon:yes gene_type:complete